jgi:hypothetical protein
VFILKERDETMTRSVEELKRESERSRQALAATTDRLREQLSHTAEDIRQIISPEHIKSEVSDYVTDKTQGWLGALKRQAMENPMQAIAAGTAIAVPVLRLARAFPLPLLMMGAGLALTSKSVRDRASKAAAPSMDKAGQEFDQAIDQSRSFANVVKDGIASAQSRVTDALQGAGDRAGDLATDLGGRAAGTQRTTADQIKGGIDAAQDTVAHFREAASATAERARTYAGGVPEKARGVIGDNAALIGGLGIAIGAVIAAALPKTDVEAGAMGEASNRLQRAAQDATQAGFDRIRDTARSAADAAQKSFADADLGAHATRMTENIAGAVKDVADDIVSAASNPSRTSNS